MDKTINNIAFQLEAIFITRLHQTVYFFCFLYLLLAVIRITPSFALAATLEALINYILPTSFARGAQTF